MRPTLLTFTALLFTQIINKLGEYETFCISVIPHEHLHLSRVKIFTKILIFSSIQFETNNLYVKFWKLIYELMNSILGRLTRMAQEFDGYQPNVSIIPPFLGDSNFIRAVKSLHAVFNPRSPMFIRENGSTYETLLNCVTKKTKVIIIYIHSTLKEVSKNKFYYQLMYIIKVVSRC